MCKLQFLGEVELFKWAVCEGHGGLSLSRSRKSNKSACLRDLQTTEKSYKLSLHVVGIYKRRPIVRTLKWRSREKSFCFTRKLLCSPHLHRVQKLTPVTATSKGWLVFLVCSPKWGLRFFYIWTFKGKAVSTRNCCSIKNQMFVVSYSLVRSSTETPAGIMSKSLTRRASQHRT